MAFQLPVVDAASLAAWYYVHLGSPAESELFLAGYLAVGVIGTRLADGREVVVRVRPAAPRLTACTEVQRRLSDSGYPCPKLLAGPAPLGEHAASAESYIPGGAALPGSGRTAQPFAAALAQLVHLAPLALAGALAGARAAAGRMEPQPGRVVALARGPGRGPETRTMGRTGIDAAGQAARQKLQEDQDQAVIGHGDWDNGQPAVGRQPAAGGLRLGQPDRPQRSCHRRAGCGHLPLPGAAHRDLRTPASSSTPTPPPADGPSVPASYSAAGPQASGRRRMTPSRSTPPA